MREIRHPQVHTKRRSRRGLDEPQLLHEFFERQVRIQPNHPAVECEGKTLTYAQLDRLSDKIAVLLAQRGIGPGSLVALYSEKSTRLFAAMLGILKAGAGYVPIDPKFPAARIRDILLDAKIEIVLSDGFLAQDLAPHVEAEVINVKDELKRPADLSPPLVPIPVGSHDVCYVIYTSGSTGRPKGVVIEHRNAVNFVRSLRSVYRLTNEDRVYQGFSIAFDASVEEIWGALALGGTLVVPSGEVARSTFDAADFINSNKITFFSTVPSFLAVLEAELPTVKLLVLGGESCHAELVQRWAIPGRRMLNTYGPTEATVVATTSECIPGKPVMIGHPLPGYDVYVLNEQLQQVKPGETGELYIGGSSVARGYLNRPELTAERFISNPFDSARLYRTFDLVRQGDFGALQFIGRADAQIKIRGFRVELAEIEAVLMEHPSIQAAAVTLYELGKQKELAAYVVLDLAAQELDRETVAKLLRARLPEYMIPRYLDIVDKLPATHSGKMDRKLLPVPRTIFGAQTVDVTLPGSELEKEILQAFEKFLLISPISVDADFFVDLRGHSLLAAHVVTELRAALDTVHVSVGDLYAHRTVRRLCQHLESLGIGVTKNSPKTSTTPDEPSVAQPPLSWFRYPCAVLQLAGLLAYYGAVSAPLTFAIVLALQVIDGELRIGSALELATSMSFLVWPSWLALSIILKWTVIGVYKPGRYPVWGPYYFRWWLVNRFQSLSWSGMFVGTPLMTLYFRAMGAKVGHNCTIGTSMCSAFDLVAIGDNTSVGSDTHILGYRVENGWLILGNVTIGSDCYVGTHSCLGLNTTMNDGAKLGDMSHLPDNAAIENSQEMQGSPAALRAVELGPLKEKADGRDRTAFAFGMLHLALIYVMGYILILSTLPGLALVGGALYVGGPAVGAAAAFAAVPFSILWYLFLVVAVKWIAIGRIRPGVYRLDGKFYLRYWFLNYLLNNTRHIVLALYATMMLPKFLRLLGAKIGRGVEISTAMHIMPDLLEIGDGSFLADACIVGGHKVYQGRIEICLNKIGSRSFIGNSALVPAGTSVGDNSLIGVMSTPPAAVSHVSDGTRLLGSPAFELPNTEKVSCFSSKQTFEPGYSLVISRSVIEALRLLLPGTVATANLVLFCVAITVAYENFPTWGLALLVPIAAFVLSVASVFVVAFVKDILIGNFKPTVQPLWCRFVWLNEVVNALYESIAATAMAPFMGTPFISVFLRLMGCKIGKWVFLETTLFSEFDLVEIGNYAALNLGATIQTHLFEDRVMKADHLKISEGCSVGNMAIVLYGTEMQQGSTLGALSVLMKGEVLPAFSDWIGIPTRPVESASQAGPKSTVAPRSIRASLLGPPEMNARRQNAERRPSRQFQIRRIRNAFRGRHRHARRTGNAWRSQDNRASRGLLSEIWRVAMRPTVTSLAVAAAISVSGGKALSNGDASRKGLDIKRTGLIPRYPSDFICPPITSFYASWDDIDGTRRDEPHSGVDAGRLGDEILAPGNGNIVAAWKADWGWGEEGAILIRHQREDIGLTTGPKFYYSEFDHLQFEEVRAMQEGARIERGAKLATVYRPGGNPRYLPEVHWEVWQVDEGDSTRWRVNEFGGRYWTNRSAHLVDPLYMLSLNAAPNDDGSVDLPIFDQKTDYATFRGFTYILACRPKD